MIEILHDVAKEDSSIKVTSQAKKGIIEFLEDMKSIQAHIKNHKPAETIENLVKKIKYRDYLVKEEGNEIVADEKYENVGQIINIAEKYVEK